MVRARMRAQLQVQNNFEKHTGLGKGKHIESMGSGMGHKSTELICKVVAKKYLRALLFQKPNDHPKLLTLEQRLLRLYELNKHMFTQNCQSTL